jgi:hypothetical protein
MISKEEDKILITRKLLNKYKKFLDKEQKG